MPAERRPLRDAPDNELALAAADGDRDALEALLDRHVDRVHSLCRRLISDPDDALDATQEAMIAVTRGITRFDGRARFTTWLYRVVTNAAIDERRRRARRPRPVEVVPDTESATHDLVAGVADRIDVDDALERLPEEFRVAVVLRDLCDVDYAQIADVLSVPPGTVRSRIARGRAELARILGNPDRSEQRPTGKEAEPLL